MAKRSIPESKPDPPQLTVLRSMAAEKISDRIKKAEPLKDPEIRTHADFELIKREYEKWSDYNEELLQRLFDNDVIKKEYEYAYPQSDVSVSPFGEGPNLREEFRNYKDTVSIKIHTLESILERLELIPESSGILGIGPVEKSSKPIGPEVFLVHGHNEGIKQTVARYIEKLDLRPIILHEQPNEGRTIIEKFEKYSTVSYAVILLTPDDVGASIDEKDNLKFRARQNVILELGFFLGRLGRERVCALYTRDVEIPSDYKGVLYISLDDGAWQLLLARELKSAGLKVDLNKAL